MHYQEIIDRLAKIEKLLTNQSDEPLDFEMAAKFLRLSKSHLYKLTTHLSRKTARGKFNLRIFSALWPRHFL